MKTNYFIRFTDTPKADLERNDSYHLSEIEYDGMVWSDYFNCWTESLGGLCAYELNSDNLEDAILEALEFKQDIFNAKSNLDSFSIYTGECISDCPEGVVINAKSIVYVKKGDYFKEI